MLRFLLLSALAATCLSTSAPAAITPAQATQVSRLLGSDLPEERAGAIRGVRQQGAAVRETYQPLLEKAQTVHKERLKAHISGSLPVLRKFSESHEKWATAREACLVLVFEKTDHEARKLAELARSYTAAERAMKEVSRHLKSPPSGLTAWQHAATALNELEAEIAWCRDAPESDQDHFRNQPAGERVKETASGPEFLKLAAPYQERLDAQAALGKATRYNEKEIRWPAPVLTAFMEVINARRHVLGQQTLRLDERLSKCAHGHSAAMQRLKFFSHESPIEGHKTPWDRAKQAEFEGNCTGENIYMGSTAAEAAYMAWWESDGHRFIMFQKDANALGLGLAGNYWTLNTGRRDWPETSSPSAKPPPPSRTR